MEDAVSTGQRARDSGERGSGGGSDESDDFVVVGIGASAGGLPALQALVAELHPSTNMAYIVAQHVSADHRSMMVELLATRTGLEVVAAEDGQLLKTGRIHVCPPGFHITVTESDRVSLSSVDDEIYPTKPSIDLLFTSLASSKGAHAIGIILSGTGSDGTTGIAAIKDADGYGIAQDPSTAKYDSMPVHAIESGRVDLVLSPEAIGKELGSISPVLDQAIPDFTTGRNREAFDQILHELSVHHRVDFSSYKMSTLSRRIVRRMIATKTDTISEYAESLTSDPDELTELFHDLLIGVSNFFRDRDAFDELRTALEGYIAAKAEHVLRFWSIGCSTGEEPYSLAILLAELLGPDLDDYRIQIFATDVNQRSIEQARRGKFSALAVSSVPDDLRDRYFSLQDGQYEISKEIKHMVVFSQHDVMQDPPFLRQDAVLCRNVLIYLGTDAHDSLLHASHYALNPGALLFLGKAEKVTDDALWETVSATAKIYRASSAAPRTLPWTTGRSSAPTLTSPKRTERPRPARELEAELETLVLDQLEQLLSPSVILINADNEIIYSHGERNPLLQRRPGRATDSIFSNMHPDILVDLRSALHQLRSGEHVVSTDFRSIELGRGPSWVRLVVTATTAETLGDLTVIYCQVEETLGAAALDDRRFTGSAAAVVVEHERQVAKLQEQLAVAMEQLDDSNEEMQALNEELQSSNEELQSSNEELETTNEELQSTNEELHTAYAELTSTFEELRTQELELERRSAQLDQANRLLVDAEAVGKTGSWRWRPSDEEIIWSPGMHVLFGTDPEQATPSFDLMTERVHDDDRQAFVDHLERLLRGDEPEPFTFRIDRNGADAWLKMVSLVALGRYRNVQQAVGKLRDVTDEVVNVARAKEQRDALQEVEQKVRILLEESVNGVYVYDLVNRRNEFLSESHAQILGWSPAEIRAMSQDEIDVFIHPDDRERMARHLRRVASLGLGEARTIRYRFRHRDGHELDLFGRDTVFEVDDHGNATKMMGSFFLIVEDDD